MSNDNDNAEAGENAANGTTENQDPPKQDAAKQMNLLFKDNSGNEVTFKLKPTTRLAKAMDAFSARVQKDRRTLRFLFEGERINDDNTPEELEMEEGDTIEVYTEQLGGSVER